MSHAGMCRRRSCRAGPARASAAGTCSRTASTATLRQRAAYRSDSEKSSDDDREYLLPHVSLPKVDVPQPQGSVIVPRGQPSCRPLGNFKDASNSTSFAAFS
jgi:hypothetical protein